MKIAYLYDVIHPYVAGGVQKRIWELSTRLAAKGHQVTIFGMKHWEGADIMYKEGVRLWGVCPPQELFADGHRSVKEAIYFAWRALPPLMRERFDVIDAANFPYFPCFSASINSLTRRSRLIITWHEIWGDYWYEYLGRKGIIGKIVERLTISLPHKAIAVSPSTKRGLERFGRKQVEVIPTGVDIRTIENVLPSARATDIIFVGRLTREKGIPLLIRAVHLIKEQRQDIGCLIIGDGPDREHLRHLVRDLDLEANVHFEGRVENDIEVFSAMKSSRVFALPSLREGLGLVVVEANACGIPVVTIKHPLNAAQDLVTDGNNGYICELSEGDMAEKILMALGSRGDWEGRCKDFAREYDWDAIVDSIEQFYQVRHG